VTKTVENTDRQSSVSTFAQTCGTGASNCCLNVFGLNVVDVTFKDDYECTTYYYFIYSLCPRNTFCGTRYLSHCHAT